jgi:hypothetical protein
MAPLAPPTAPRHGRLVLVALAAALLGAAGLALGLVQDPARALHAYLCAFATAATVAVGALILQLVGYAANARWMSVTRRLLGVVALAVVPLALLFVPVACGAAWLYLWADPATVATLPEATRALLAHKAPYLNLPAFVIRGAVYFVIWIVAAGLLHVWSRRRDSAAPASEPAAPEVALGRERAFASAMLPPVGFALSFASFDWLMSLEPTWSSTIFGIYVFAGGFLGAIALTALLAYAGRRAAAPELVTALTPHHFHALGRLLLAFTVFWAYVAYFQVFLIQIADKPVEVSFYLHRLGGSWRPFVDAVAIGHFALPFLLLLPRAPKHRPGYVAAIAAWLLLMHYLDVYWLVLPTVHPGGVAPALVDLAALLFVGGVCVSSCALVQRRASLVAQGDPFLPEGLGYVSPT